MARRLRLLACALGLACGDGSPDEPTHEPLEYREGRVALPDCPGFDYSRCDTRETSCVETLAAIAHCMRGGPEPFAAPAFSFQSEIEAFDRFLADANESPPPSPNHFEIALVKFGLSEPRAFEPEVLAERYSLEIDAYYDRDTKSIIVIEHPPRDGEDADWLSLQRPPLLLHELVHALQDQQHDLNAFSEKNQGGTDQALRNASVIEGEARLHERRYYAALTGLDISEIDLERSFDSLASNTERFLFEQSDLYGMSRLTAPYGAGSRFVYQVWSDGGPLAVQALFDAPPHSMQEVLAMAWGGSTASELVEVPPAQIPGATLSAWTSLGAWGLYLILEPLVEDRARARALALDWRGDRFEAFATEAGETLARWQISLADAGAAERFAAALSGHALLAVSSNERNVVLTPWD